MTSTAIVKVTPISGSRQEYAPSCYLLEIDQAKILLDAGSTSTLSNDHLSILKKLTKSLDLVLLSHGDLQHCGALPKIVASFEINGPILATVPVHHLGLVTLYDAYESFYEATGDHPPGLSLDDIDAAFERITILRYSQSHTISTGLGMGIQVTPIAAGHSLGGAMWRIRKHTEEIFYAIDFNHRKETHLDGASLDVVQRPSLLIADSKGALDVPMPRKQRDSDLCESILNCLRPGGTALLPTETAGRALELLQVLEAYWRETRQTFPIFFLSHQSQRVLDLAKGMLEWMSPSLAKVFEQDRSNPFELSFVKICHNLAEIENIVGGKVILATEASLDTGHSRLLLTRLIEQPTTCIIFTTKAAVDSLAVKVLGSEKGHPLTVTSAEQVPLEGEELEQFKLKRQEEDDLRAAEEAFAQLQRQREDESESESEGAEVAVSTAAENRRLEQEQINSAAALQNFYWTDYKQDWYIDPNSIPARLFANPANNPFFPMIPPEHQCSADGIPTRYQVFPFREINCMKDDYGEMVDPSEFGPKSRSPLEAVVPSGFNTSSATSSTNLIQSIAPISKPALPSHPMKWLVNTQELTVKALRKFIDFSGVSDGRSLKTIYSRIQPRRLLLVGGSSEATDFLANYFLQSISGSSSIEVFTPHLGETITVSAALNVSQALLTESLIAQLKLRMLGEYELAWVKATVLRNPKETTMDIDDEMATEDTPEELVVGADNEQMIHLSASEDSSFATPSPILIGDPKLSEIRRLVQTQLRIPAVFIDGDLVCGTGENRVMIRRETTDGSELSLQGPISDEYYKVRSILYSTTAMIQ